MKKIFINEPLADTVVLPKDITHHILHVFRHDIRKPVPISDREGHCGLYLIEGEINGEAHARLLEYTDSAESVSRCILVQSYLKGDKLEWVLQKATELNADTIYLVRTKNCIASYDEKKLSAKLSRWEKIVLEAAQQCGRSQLPAIVVSQTLQDILAAESQACRMVAYEREDSNTIKHSLVQSRTAGVKDYLICIGPEGGFQEKEINDMIKCGAVPVTLGSSVLRAETAAVAAMAMMQYELEIH